MVDGVDVVSLVETVLDEKETIHPFQSFVGSSHLNNDNGAVQNFGCRTCATYFTNKAEYDRHNENNCNSGKTYLCSVCTASFRRHDHLKRHLTSVHSNVNTLNVEQYSQALGCAACDRYFNNKAEYDLHNEKNCGNGKSYPCSICTASFRRHDHLKRHLSSVHSNSKYYTCPVCNEDCKRHDMLLKHIKSRHTDKPCVFHCKECTYECGSLSDFEKHERMHLLNERHLCPHCNTSFKRRDHMLRHVKSQHLLQHSICPICEQTFKRRDHVARHIREKHNRR